MGREIIIYAEIRWRVRLHPNPPQWVIEKKPNVKAKYQEWVGVSWCQTRKALLRCWHEITGQPAPDYLHTLPDLARKMDEVRL